jgi:acetate kinase
MRILVLNCGSSSVKYQLIDTSVNIALAKGMVSRIGMSDALLNHKPFDRPEVKISAEILDHIMAIEYVVQTLQHTDHGVMKDKSEIQGVGHRVVHGGEEFSDSALITSDILSQIRNCVDLAPLHNPHNIKGINAAQRIFPGVPQVAVFDTAFHQMMPPASYVYGIPYILYKKYGIRRYGFHGTSHHYVAHRAAQLLRKELKDLLMITCHLGNGASITAIKDGKSTDTSMGFTPLEGLLMGTRSGDLDPAVILYIMGHEELTLNEANTLLNKHGGLQGISGVSSDMKDILEESEKGNKSAKLALDIYCYRIRKYIGAYAAALGGLDVLVFTAGIGENAPAVRKKACKNLEILGIKIDEKRNQEAIKKEAMISSPKARVKVLVIPTNEELVIARDTERIIHEVQRRRVMHKGV